MHKYNKIYNERMTHQVLEWFGYLLHFIETMFMYSVSINGLFSGWDLLNTLIFFQDQY